jgi:serine/threonine protein kinase
MLSGLPPFYYKNKNDLYEAIIHKEPSFKSCISAKAKDLIQKLLIKDPK